MKTQTLLIFLAALFATFATQAQQSPQTPQPAQTQTAPCTAVPSGAPATRANNSGSTILNKWKVDQESAKLATATGVPMPTTDDLGSVGSPKPAPCPPKTATPASAGVAQPAPVKLPPDTTVTLHCNPLTPSPQGGARQTTLTLPDPKDFAVPKANDFLADSVVPDTAAKTPCYLIKVDPRTGKSFVQQ